MTDHIGASKQTGGNNSSPSEKREALQPSAVDYVVRVFPVDNPLDLTELRHQRIFQVWKVLVDQNGVILQVMGMISSTVIDTRFGPN